jgi:SAM-dependent methyltransferase
MNLKYEEQLRDLTIRIEAHKKYSSLKVEDVLDRTLDDRRWARILDAGCGSGNFTETLARACDVYTGADKNTALLREASDRCRHKGIRNVLFVSVDFDLAMPFIADTFDMIFFGYSAYYVEGAESLIMRSRDVLCSDGKLLLLGPTEGNAVELDWLSLELFGISSSQEKKERVNRLRDEFVPALGRIFGNVNTNEYDCSLQFPAATDYAAYYRATPQYLELMRIHGERTQDAVIAAVDRMATMTLTKKCVLISAEKK